MRISHVVRVSSAANRPMIALHAGKLYNVKSMYKVAACSGPMRAINDSLPLSIVLFRLLRSR